MQLACDDVVSGLGCDFVAAGESAEDVKNAMLTHGGAVHSNLMADMSPEEAEKAYGEMVQHIEQLIAQKA